jgi:two-component system response regulator AtoC
MSGAGAISVVKEIDSHAAIIAFSQTDGDVVTESILKGAYECVTSPFELDDVECAVERALAQRRLEFEAHTLRWKLIDRASKKIFGRNASGEQLRDLVENLVHSKSAVLITGEDGTGKEFVAHFIHYKSRRGSTPFIRVNCRLIPEDLLEGDLFGVQKESMDSAERPKPGKLELCHHGTAFLDGIDSIPLTVQAKLLKLVETRELVRKGGEKPVSLDTRIIASSDQKLSDLKKRKKLIKKLCRHLESSCIHLPPLRERIEDLPFLVEQFLQELNVRLGTSINGISRRGMELLLSHHWPGNLRELANTLERAAKLSLDSVISGVLISVATQSMSGNSQQDPNTQDCLWSSWTVNPGLFNSSENIRIH